MGLERNREKEKEMKKKEKQKKYNDNHINVSINIGSEDLIESNNNNEEIIDSNIDQSAPVVLPEEVPEEIEKDDIFKTDITDVLLTELRGNLNEFNSKKKKLMDSKMDIPNEIFELPDIDLKSEVDIKNLNDLIKEKIRKLDTILLDLQPRILPSIPVTERTPQTIPVTSPFVSRGSPFGFPTITRPSPIPTRVDNVERSTSLLNDWKNKYNNLINTTDIGPIQNLITESNELEKLLGSLKLAEVDSSKKTLIQNDIQLLQGLRSNLNILIQQLKEVKPPEGQPPEEPEAPAPAPAPEQIDTSGIDRRLIKLNEYKQQIIPTGRTPSVTDFLNKQVDDLISKLTLAKQKVVLTPNERDFLLSLTVDLDKGSYPAVRALRSVNKDEILSPDAKLELRLYDNPQLPPNAGKQYKLYIDDEVLTEPRIGEIIFNTNGDLYRREDIEGSVGTPSSIVPEEQEVPAPAPEAPAPAPAPEPAPAPTEVTDARRAQLLDYRNSLYYTGLPDIDSIVDRLNIQLESALSDPTFFTVLDLTGGSVPAAIAWVSSFPNTYPRDVNESVNFIPLPDLRPAGGSIPFHLEVGNTPVSSTGTSTPKLFNEFGGAYGPNDYSGEQINKTFPFVGQVPPEYTFTETTPVQEIPTGPWSEVFNDDAERAYLTLYNRELVQTNPYDITQLSFVRPRMQWRGFVDFYILKVDNNEIPEYKFRLDDFTLIEDETQIGDGTQWGETRP